MLGVMKFSAADRAHVYHEFAKLLAAGFGVDKACESLMAHRAKPVVKQLAADVKDGVEHGLTVADALGSSSIDVGDLEVRLVEAGEKAGRLADSFEELATVYETSVKTRRQMIGALIYPAVLIHLACILPAIPVGFTKQSFAAFFVAAAVPLVIVYIIGIVGYFAWNHLSKKARTDASTDALLNRIPAVGRARKALALSRFCHVFGIFLLAGQRTSEAVTAAGESSGSGSLLAAGNRLAAIATAGDPIGPPMLSEPAIHLDVSRRVASAEEVGGMEKELAKCAALQRAQAAESASRAAKAFSTVIYVVAMLLVVYQVISMTLGRMQVYKDILDGM